MGRTRLLILVLFTFVYQINSYKTVIYMHGILSNSDEANVMLKWIQQDHPGTETVSIDMFNDVDSLVDIMEQVDQVGKVMMRTMSQNPDGVNLICFSQGGVVCRGVLEQFKHNVDTFISLSSPQMGQFGDTDYLKFLFPHLLRDEIYKICYTEFGQNISVCNYWRDPLHEGYEKWSRFLAVINNDTHNPHSEEFKSNFLRLNKLVMIGGPDDGVITPWQSSHFGYYDSSLKIVEQKDQKIYKNDDIGLQTLDKRGALITHVIPGVEHVHWYRNQDVYKRYILPNLN